MKKNISILLLLAICVVGGGMQYARHIHTSASAETGDEEATREMIEFASVESDQRTAKSDSFPVTNEENDIALGSEAASEEQKETVRIENPSQEYYLAVENKAMGEHTVILRELSSEPNEIIDDEAWFLDNQLTLNALQIPGVRGHRVGDIPPAIPTIISHEEQNLMLVEAIKAENDICCIYGADYGEGYIMQIYDSETQQLQYNMDFTEYRYANDYSPEEEDYVQQRIWWCSIVDNVLYVSIGHNTYTSSSPHTGYLVAIDLENETVLWKTEPITCNSYNFAIIGDEIICGYGFTSEADYLYQVDRQTGVRLEQIPVKTQVNYILQRDGLLYVRTYDTNYVFEIE